MENSIRKDRPAVLKSTRDIEYSIFKRRRLRSSKACYPCRRRKVKCGLGKPCNTCSSRGHPDLCDYTAQIPSTGVEAGNSDTQGTAPQEDGLSRFDRNPGLYVDPLVPYTSKLHIGSDSLPRLLSNYQRLNPCRPKNTSAITATGVESNSQTIFEVLCLQDSSTSFQFTNLWQPGDGLELVYNALPEDEVILNIVHFCQGSIFHILPSIIYFPELEATLTLFLSERAKSLPGTLLVPPSNCTANWFGLLFSILACGVQLSAENGEFDMLKARVFACCSFQCLRLSNFISFPTIEVVQTLILLVNFLMNQADAGASWSMLGLAIRLAQSIGLYFPSDPDGMKDSVEKDKATTEHYIWRALVWQDTLLSLCYDRSCGISVPENMPLITLHKSENHLFSFSDSCHHLFVAANRISQALNSAKLSGQQLSLQAITDYIGLLNRIESQSIPHVQNASKCQTRDDYIQHYFFKTFSDSVMLYLCRPSILSNGKPEQKDLAEIYLSRSYSVLETYLELLRMDCPIRRSWLFVHIALSCALSLGMTAMDSDDIRNQATLRHFVDTLSRTSICANVSAYERALEHLQGLVKTFE